MEPPEKERRPSRKTLTINSPRAGGVSSRSSLRLGSSHSSTKEGLQAPRKLKLRDEHHAASMGQMRWLQISLQKAESPTQGDINGFSALHMASLHGRLDCIQLMIEKYGVNINLASLRGWRPIHLVLSKEAKDMALHCLQYLIGKGADVNVQNQNGISPLHKAASEGREECISVLIDAGADVHAKDSEGQEPLDVCIMWGHKLSARTVIRKHKHCFNDLFLLRNSNRSVSIQTYKKADATRIYRCLRSAIWKLDKAHFAREICRLNEIKLQCDLQRQEFLRKGQMEWDMSNTCAYKEWLAKKRLPAPPVRVIGLQGKRRLSVNLRKYARETVTSLPTPSIIPPVTGKMLDAGLPQKDWNFSTNPSSAPAASIFRPNTVRIGVDPEKAPDPDLTSFVFLQKNAFGEPEIQINNMGKVPFVPDLPFKVLENSLYPRTRTTRLKVPEDLRPLHLLNMKHKRPPGPEHQWTDQMAVSLRQTVDPVFISTLKAHVSSYGDPKLLSPRPELGSSQGTETASISSNGNSCQD